MIKVKKFNKTLKKMAEIATGDTFKIETERDWCTDDNDWDTFKFYMGHSLGDYNLLFTIYSDGGIDFEPEYQFSLELINILPSLCSLIKYRNV